MSKILKVFLCCLFLLPAGKAFSQVGQYIFLWGGPQLVTMNNFYDYNVFVQGNNLDRVTTYRGAVGLDYVYNFDTTYGFQTGFIFSQQGQKYSGLITRDYYNSSAADTYNFSSHVYVNYFRIPLMFRFNSEIVPDERMNMSLFMGFSINILQGVQEVYSNPAPPASATDSFSNFNFNKLYKKVGMGLGAGAQVNIRITPVLGSVIGIRFDRSMGNVENIGYPFPKNIPVEYMFPVSTKKELRPDESTRSNTKNTIVNVYVGLSFKLGGGKR